MKKLADYKLGFYGKMEELVQDLENNGYEVLDANTECLTVANPRNDFEYLLMIGGTESTIIVTAVL